LDKTRMQVVGFLPVSDRRIFLELSPNELTTGIDFYLSAHEFITLGIESPPWIQSFEYW